MPAITPPPRRSPPSRKLAETLAARAARSAARGGAIGFSTGATVANGTCLAAARTGTLLKAGWDPDADGLFGAPPVHVLIGADAHSSLFASLQLIGFGSKRVHQDRDRRAGADAARGAQGGDRRARRAQKSSSRRRARSTPAISTRSRRSPISPRRMAPGCMSTAPSGSGPAPRRRAEASDGGHRARRFLGHRRPQMAAGAL